MDKWDTIQYDVRDQYPNIEEDEEIDEIELLLKGIDVSD